MDLLWCTRVRELVQCLGAEALAEKGECEQRVPLSGCSPVPLGGWRCHTGEVYQRSHARLRFALSK